MEIFVKNMYLYKEHQCFVMKDLGMMTALNYLSSLVRWCLGQEETSGDPIFVPYHSDYLVKMTEWTLRGKLVEQRRDNLIPFL